MEELQQCPKCGGEDILDESCLDCGINLTGWNSVEVPAEPLNDRVLPLTQEWINSLGVPMYDSLDEDGE